MDALKVVQDFIESSGSTWYMPEKGKEYPFLRAVQRGVLVEDKGYFSLPLIKRREEEIAKYAIARLQQPMSRINKRTIDVFVDLYQEQEGITLDYWQRDAVHIAVNSNLFVLTGGPGTGKTCVLKCIRFCLQAMGLKDILFCAPTGKAARRITESVGSDAKTVAKALRLISEDAIPKKISNEVIVVDEISMLDTYTAHALFTSASLSSRLILVGDVEQLPSVGCGSVLRDLIYSGAIPCAKLEKTFRQASESGLFANIEQIKSGLHLGFEERDDFKVFSAESTEDAKTIMIDQFLQAIDEYGIDNVVCLTPYRRKGEACAIRLNQILQNVINPAAPDKRYVSYTVTEDDGFKYDIILRVGDPVMQLVNASQVANGDVGKVSRIDTEKGILYVQFIDCEVAYSKRELGQLTLAYAMSVHKSQGSEYACVITSAIESDYDMLSRNTIYTAVTRAKKECRVVTNGDVAKRACQKELGYERKTMLADDLIYEDRKFRMLSKLIIA